MQFVIVHEISGLQGRLRARALSGFSRRMARDMTERLARVPGLAGIRVNALTGSVLLRYAGAFARSAALEVLGIAATPSAPSAPPASSARPAPCAGRAPAAESPSRGLFPLVRYLALRPFLPFAARVVAAVLMAAPILKRGLAALCRGRITVDVLDAAAVAVSLLRRDFRTVGLLAVFLGIGEVLESWTRKKTLDSLAGSLASDVELVRVSRDGKEIFASLDSLEEDDLVVVESGRIIPVDGVVEAGAALIDQASLTGETGAVSRAAGAAVFAGTVVEEGALRIRPTAVGDAARLPHIVRFIKKAEALKGDMESRVLHLADAAAPFSFLLAGLVLLVTRDPARAASVLLVDYSCALRLATPLAVLAAMREAASRGVLVKGGRFLEGLARADVVIFDKTGTLTQAAPEVAEVISTPCGGGSEEVLRLAACLEEHFPHPLARAVVRRAEEAGLLHPEEHGEVEYVAAHGIASHLHGKRVLLGSRHYVQEDEGVAVEGLEEQARALSEHGLSLLYLAVDGKLAGIIGLEDPLRPEAISAIRGLRDDGLERIIMLTGDDERTAASVAARLGIDEYRAGALPADKAAVIRQLQAEGRTVIMVGGGCHDAPALAAADVGVTLSEGAALVRDVAGVVLADGQPDGLLFARQLARRALRRINDNFRLTMVLNSLFLAAGLGGVLQPSAAAVLHNMTTAGAALNAMRPVLPPSRGDV